MAVDTRERAPQPQTAGQVALNLELQWKQWTAFSSAATEMLYGGAAFGGKSHLIRVAAINWCTDIAGLQVYIFRRVEDDLIKNHMEGPHSFRELLAPWVQAGLVEILATEIRFKFNGSKIFLCHCKDEKHRFKYHGSEIHVLIVDELTTFTELIYRYLRFRTRMVGIKKFEKDTEIDGVQYKAGDYRPTYPKKFRAGEIGPDGKTVNTHDLFPRILNGSNPGNVGHHWVKREFIDPVPPLTTWKTEDRQGGMYRAYIPARVADNPIGLREDPEYLLRMRGLADPGLVKAMEDGDWNVVAGGFFPEFSRSRHVVRPMKLPLRWKRFRGHDWGSARPFSSGWYAIAQDDIDAVGSIGNPIRIPRGSLIRYREWYGQKPGETNIGLNLPATSWAKGVVRRSPVEESIEYDVIDPSAFKEDGGPSIAERAMSEEGAGERMSHMRPADNQRIGGWNQVRQRLQGDDPEHGITDPTLYLFENCTEAIRTMEGLQRDEIRVEDADTDNEDHAPDEIRYACMSRPRRRPNAEDRFKHLPKEGTLEWLDLVTNVASRGQSMPGMSKRPLD